jgi:heme/copper-type cytochrome/quinol oxidase subunit 2
MPVVVRALSPEDYEAWVLQQDNKNMAKTKGSSTSSSKIAVAANTPAAST